ncbi:MAG: DNA polymerase III subunit gamma/tau [Anaerolineales bacterium]|jgi:DNA polymerase-3 subunit gamma/tau
MTQALYNKWRPQKWDEIVGQQHVVQTLRNAVVGGRVVHAYLFAGPRGTGKTTAARLLAKAVNCLDEDPAARPCNKCAHCLAVNENRYLDLIEIDAASNTSVEDVRDLRDKINFSPNEGTYKVYIIDEVHMLSTAAFNALLKTLEEPPAHAIFILATTEMHKIPATVLSRCQRYEFRRLPMDGIVGQLQNIVTKEKLTADPEALTLIARQSAGGMRDAISLLDQMASTGQEITLGLTQIVLGTATNQTVLDLVRAVLDRDPASGMDAIHTALDSGTDPRLLARQVVDYLRALLLIQMGNASQVDLTSDTRFQAEKQAKAFSQADILRLIRSFNNAAVDLRGGWQPSLPLELALAEVMDLPAMTASGGAQSASKPPVDAKLEKQVGKIAHETQKPAKDSGNVMLYQTSGPETSTEDSSSVTLDQVAKAWKQISALIKPQSPSLAALLNSCRPLEIKNNLLLIGFANELVRSKMDTTEQIEITRKAIAKVCGGNLSIKCVVSNAKQAPPANVKADGMVAAALKKGGEIVDIQE